MAVSDRPLVLISTPWIGGAGGIERYAHAAAHALSKTADVTLVYDEDKSGSWSQLPDSVTAIQSEEFRRATGPRSRRPRWLARRGRRTPSILVPTEFDLHLALAKRPALRKIAEARFSLIVPGGKSVGPKTLPFYDAVAAEAPSNMEFLQTAGRVVLLPPPLADLAEAVPPTGDLPDNFLLTVFNPYGPIKGQDVLESVIDELPLTLVWVHSTRTIDFEISTKLRHHRRIVHLDDPSPGQIRWLYERTAAYISFSRSEGFGWAVADALRYSTRVLSRKTGVMSFPEARALPGVSTYDDADELTACLSHERADETPRDLRWLSTVTFAERIEKLILR